MIAISGLEVKQYYVTKEGAEELQQLLENLKLGRTKLLEEVRSLASETGSVLDDPLQAYNFHKAEEINTQIARLQRILARVKIIKKPLVNKRVQLGSRVVVAIGDAEHVYTILGSIEADPTQGKISNESPLGRLLMGRKTGDSFEITMRSQLITGTITDIQ